ncbi:MAG: hypothetical protein K0S53_507 [Bacteroidetes bacterium]|jgi:hypothetical protein|nr:hypothetical protein [Bacteroidota bacterium]MDF2451872.1 hypothetical protein [Bacteroidota bacterium]
MRLNYQVTPIFQDKTITMPFAEPIVLKGTREDKNYAFIFTHGGENYYIFVTLEQGVINHNLPNELEHAFKQLLIESVNKYCESSRQGLPDNVFITQLKKNASRWRANDITTNSGLEQPGI